MDVGSEPLGLACRERGGELDVIVACTGEASLGHFVLLRDGTYGPYDPDWAPLPEEVGSAVRVAFSPDGWRVAATGHDSGRVHTL